MSTEPLNPLGTGVNFVKKTVSFELLVPEGFELKEGRVLSTFPDIVDLSTKVNILSEIVSINIQANVILEKNL